MKSENYAMIVDQSLRETVHTLRKYLGKEVYSNDQCRDDVLKPGGRTMDRRLGHRGSCVHEVERVFHVTYNASLQKTPHGKNSRKKN